MHWYCTDQKINTFYECFKIFLALCTEIELKQTTYGKSAPKHIKSTTHQLSTHMRLESFFHTSNSEQGLGQVCALLKRLGVCLSVFCSSWFWLWKHLKISMMNETQETYLEKRLRTEFYCYNFISFKWTSPICTSQVRERNFTYYWRQLIISSLCSSSSCHFGNDLN